MDNVTVGLHLVRISVMCIWVAKKHTEHCLQQQQQQQLVKRP